MKNLKHVNTYRYLYALTRDKMFRPTQYVIANFENEPFAHYISTYTDDIRRQLNDEIEDIVNVSSKNRNNKSNI